MIDTHVHEIETETAYVMAGQGVLTVGNDQVSFETGIGATIPPGLPHSLRNMGDVPLELIAIHTPPAR